MAHPASKHPTSADYVHQVLLDAIVSGELGAGAVIRDQEWAAALGVSRTPVREALQRLQGQGVAEIAAARFTRLVSFSPATALDEARGWATAHRVLLQTLPDTAPKDLLQSLFNARMQFGAARGSRGRHSASFTFYRTLRGATSAFGIRLAASTSAYRLRLADGQLHRTPAAELALQDGVLQAMRSGEQKRTDLAFEQWLSTLTS